jgi:formylglycine-generating enzyme required for sulfatase activity
MTFPLYDNFIIPIGEASVSVDLHLTLVEPSCFHMGSNSENAFDDEQPVHEVQLDTSFYISTFPVTQAQWKAVFPSHDLNGFQNLNHPVVDVSWYDIVDGSQKNGPPEAFLTRINRYLEGSVDWPDFAFRLPTEVEWEYVAKGGHLSSQILSDEFSAKALYPEYSGSDDLLRASWCSTTANGNIHPVGRKQANRLGIHDLTGNIWEWCADTYEENDYKNRKNKTIIDPKDSKVPGGKVLRRILRGGSWAEDEKRSRLTNRLSYKPDYRGDFYGFRLIFAPVKDNK